MMILYFRLLIFMSQIMLYFLHSISILSFYIDVVLTFSSKPLAVDQAAIEHRLHGSVMDF